MNIAVYCGSTSGKKESYTIGAMALGVWIAEQGHTLVYGGANSGLMGTVANAVLANGGRVIGVLPDVPLIQSKRHPGLTEYISTADMAGRKNKMMELADAYVALPGGPGTLDEISDILALSKLGMDEKPCVLFDIDGFYQPFRNLLETMIEAEFVLQSELSHVLISGSLEEIGTFIEDEA